MRKSEFISVRKVTGMVALFTIALLLTSTIAQIAISINASPPDITVIQIGNSRNVEIAVSTFKNAESFYGGGSLTVEVKSVFTYQEFKEIIQNPIQGKIIFGHGSINGLKFPKSELILWKTLISLVESVNQVIPVMACYSGLSEDAQDSKYWIGIPFELDAEAAGLMGYFIMNEKIEIESDIAGHIIPLILKKQEKLNHPLGIDAIPREMLVLYRRSYGATMADVKMQSKIKYLFDLMGLCIGPNSLAVTLVPDVLDDGVVPFLPSDLLELLKDTGFFEAEWEVLQALKYYLGDIFAVGWVVPVLWNHIFREWVSGPIGTYITAEYMALYVTCDDDLGIYPIIFDIYINYEVILREKNDEDDKANQKHPGFVPDSKPMKKRIEEETQSFATALVVALTSNGNVIRDIVDGIVAVAIACILALGIIGAGSALINSGLLFSMVASFQAMFTGLGLTNPEPTTKTLFVLVALALGVWLLIDFGPTAVAAFQDGETEVEEVEEEYQKDTDEDGLFDDVEEYIGTDITEADTDEDGYTDYEEYFRGFDPLDASEPGTDTIFDSTLHPPGGGDMVRLTKCGVNKRHDKVEIYRNGQLYDTVDTTSSSILSSEIEVIDTSGSLEWTEIELRYLAWNNTLGTEYISLYNETYYAHDQDGSVTDSDNDGLPDYYENQIGTYINDMDSDDDNLDDEYEQIYAGTDPQCSDTDKDGISDGNEFNNGYGTLYPTEAYRSYWDPDNDSMPNWVDFDRDGDGLNDSYEDTNCNGIYDSGTDYSDLNDNDTDGDNLLDGDEDLFGTNPKNADTDNDGFSDPFEIANRLNPNLDDTDDWAYLFQDDFTINNEKNDGWTDISSYGSIRRGGLASSTPYQDFQADENSVVRVFNASSGDWTFDTSANPQVTAYSSSSQFYAFVISWNLTNLRSTTPDQAIESSTLKLDYYYNDGWDSDDKIHIALLNAYCNGSYINDTSTTAHINYSLNNNYQNILEDVSVSNNGDSVISITDLVEKWYFETNNDILSILVYPDPDNNVGGTSETLRWYQGGGTGWAPKITVKTGDSVLRAEDFGSAAGVWHGPEWYHNVGCDIDDFNCTFEPYFQGSTTGLGKIIIDFYSSDNGTGTKVFSIIITDSWGSYDRGKLYIYDQTTNKWSSGYTDYADWYTEGEDNCSLVRDGSSLKFYADGLQKVSWTGTTTAIRSIKISMYEYSTNSNIPKQGIRNLLFQGHSDDYDDDGLTNSEEEDIGTSIWNTDSDRDGMPDVWEADYTPDLDPTVNDADEDPDGDGQTNYEEYVAGTDPTVYNTLADILTASYIGFDDTTWICDSVMRIEINTADTYYIKVEYRVDGGSWIQVRWSSTYYTTGYHTIWDYGFYDGEENERVDVRWNIYDSTGNTLVDQYSEYIILTS